MPTPYRPEIFSVEGVIAYFDECKGTCFRILAGTNPKTDDWSRGEYCDGDKAVAMEKLENCLIALKQNLENTNPYTIQVFNLVKGKQVDKNTTIFQLNKVERYLPFQQQVADPRLSGLLEKSIENQNLIISKLSAIENEPEEDEEDEDKSVIGSILKRDDVQALLINGLAAVVSGLVNRYSPPPSYGGGVAGVVDQNSIELLQSLFNKGVDNEVLRKLDDMSEAKLKSLLLML